MTPPALMDVGGVAALHPAAVRGVMDDLALLGGSHLTGINVQRHTAFLADMPQKREFVS